MRAHLRTILPSLISSATTATHIDGHCFMVCLLSPPSYCDRWHKWNTFSALSESALGSYRPLRQRLWLTCDNHYTAWASNLGQMSAVTRTVRVLNRSPFPRKVSIKACDSLRRLTAADNWRNQDPLVSQSVRYMNIGRRQVKLNARYLKYSISHILARLIL